MSNQNYKWLPLKRVEDLLLLRFGDHLSFCGNAHVLSLADYDKALGGLCAFVGVKDGNRLNNPMRRLNEEELDYLSSRGWPRCADDAMWVDIMAGLLGLISDNVKQAFDPKDPLPLQLVALDKVLADELKNWADDENPFPYQLRLPASAVERVDQAAAMCVSFRNGAESMKPEFVRSPLDGANRRVLKKEDLEGVAMVGLGSVIEVDGGRYAVVSAGWDKYLLANPVNGRRWGDATHIEGLGSWFDMTDHERKLERLKDDPGFRQSVLRWLGVSHSYALPHLVVDRKFDPIGLRVPGEE